MTPVSTLTVGKADDGPWSILLDGVEVETVRSHCDAWEVLLRAETYAAGDVLWRLLDDGGLEAVVATIETKG